MRLPQALERIPEPHVHFLPIIESSPFEFAIVGREPKRLHQMERGTSRETKAADIARVRWNLGLDQDDVKHKVSTADDPARLCHNRNAERGRCEWAGNSKSEIRRSKQYQMFQRVKFETAQPAEFRFDDFFHSLIRICFGFRYSNFEFPARQPHHHRTVECLKG